ncbi:hypothetical protein VTK26DRAFT_1190 [Humicola hyalothermophila]
MRLSLSTVLQACALWSLSAPFVAPYPLGETLGLNASFVLDARADAPDFYARILPLGASIVYGVGSTDRNGFRKPLRDALRQRGWKVNMVGSLGNGGMKDNSVEAKSGNRVDQVRTAAKASYKYQPNIVVINAGTNDCDQNYDVDHVGERMNGLLDDIYREVPNTTVILSTLIVSTKETIASRRDYVNSQYRSLVYKRRYGDKQKIVLADMDTPGTPFLTEADLVADGIHPTDEGHRKLASIFLRAILEAHEAGFITPPNETPSVPDDSAGGGGDTCEKRYGVARGPVKTQQGSGLSDGIYKHDSKYRGVKLTITTEEPTEFWFANIATSNFDKLSDLIQYGEGDPERGGRWYTRYAALGSGRWDLSNPKRFWMPNGCIARGVRWADIDGDGIDDFLCISPDGEVYASLTNIGWTSPAKWKASEGFPQSRVRIADVDGDGRADYCVVLDTGDVKCWRNGGQGDMPEYWQALGIVFTGKGKGDVDGVRFYDINGDARDDWLWLNDEGETWTYTNTRGCKKGKLGQGLTPEWRAGENKVDGPGHTHAGLGIANVRDQIHFARAYGDSVTFSLRPRADYIRIEPRKLNDGAMEYRFHIWENLGSGGAKPKADGSRYCNMMGHSNGAMDYVWVHSTGYMRIYESLGGNFPSSPPYWGRNYIIFDPEALIGRKLNRRHLYLADWDGDGLCDIIHVDWAGVDAMEVWINKYKKNGNFNEWEHWTEGNGLPDPAPWCFPPDGHGVLDNSVQFADLDGNGLADFLCLEPDGRTWGYLNFDGGKRLELHSQFKFSEGKDRANLRFADVNGDGKADLLWVDKFNGDTTVWYNRGRKDVSGSSFAWAKKGKLYQGAAQGSCTMFPDLDGNGRADMHVVRVLENTALTWFNDCGDRGGDDADTLTTPAVQPGPEVNEDVEAFLAAQYEAGYRGVISPDDVVSMATVLTGFQGCDRLDKRAIYGGWYQSWKLMDFIRPKVSGLDFNSAAAVEYLGPPAVISPYFDRFKEIIGNLATFQEGPWWRPGWFDYKINARCDDPGLRCPCFSRPDSTTIAYSRSRTSTNNSMINFCPPYFELPNLDRAIEDGYGGGLLVDEFANLNSYLDNQASIWIHELLHLDDVSKATGDLGKRVVDVRMTVPLGGGRRQVVTAYGPILSKSLARFGPSTGVSWTHRNDDNIGLYILALYIQEKVLNGIYPHLPLAPAPPVGIENPGSPNSPPIAIGDWLILQPNDTATPTGDGYGNDQCSPDEEDGSVEVEFKYSNLATRDLFPDDYLSQFEAWL